MAEPLHDVTFREATRTWAYVAANSFGGPAGQIAVMHRVVVDEKKWVGEERFLHALNFCMLLPGPEAHQLVTYLGWVLHGPRGALVAGGLFVLPGFVAILALSALYVTAGHLPAVDGLLFGLKAAVVAVVVEAVVRIGRRVLKNRAMFAIAAAAFVAIALFHVPFPLVVACAALVGAVGDRFSPATFRVVRAQGAGATGAVDTVLSAAVDRPSVRRTARILVGGLVLWLGPVLALAVALGPDHVLVQLGTFFSQAAVVTFGGAYAVLAYVAQHAVEAMNWLEPEEMLDGLGLAETTPGPLIMVVEFVGFVAAFRSPGSLPPLAMATLGAVITTWVTFAPSFLWILAGGPWVEWIRKHPGLGAALSAITAAVVGVVLDLALWFFLHVAFGTVEDVAGPLGTTLPIPDPSTVVPTAIALAVASGVALLRYGVGMLKVLAASAIAGLLWTLVT